MFPRPFLELADALGDGDEQAAGAAQHRVKQAVDAVGGADIALLKVGLSLQGQPAGPTRVALDRPTPEQLETAAHCCPGPHLTTPTPSRFPINRSKAVYPDRPSPVLRSPRSENPQPKGSLIMTAPHPLPTERTAVITGGASPRGIGRATADRLARDGWSVAILDIDGVAAKLAAAEVAEKYSVSTLGVAADISDESVQAAIAQVESTLPPVIGLANVAGVSSPTEFMDVTPRSGTGCSTSTCAVPSWSPNGCCPR